MTNKKPIFKSKKELIYERTLRIHELRKTKTQKATAKELNIKRSIVADTEREKFNIWGV